MSWKELKWVFHPSLIDIFFSYSLLSNVDVLFSLPHAPLSFRFNITLWICVNFLLFLLLDQNVQRFKELGLIIGGEYFIPEESYDILKKEYDELTKLIQISLPRFLSLSRSSLFSLCSSSFSLSLFSSFLCTFHFFISSFEGKKL